jgi:hypothetical protein
MRVEVKWHTPTDVLTSWKKRATLENFWQNIDEKSRGLGWDEKTGGGRSRLHMELEAKKISRNKWLLNPWAQSQPIGTVAKDELADVQK